jgi:hypothetical protein
MRYRKRNYPSKYINEIQTPTPALYEQQCQQELKAKPPQGEKWNKGNVSSGQTVCSVPHIHNKNSISTSSKTSILTNINKKPAHYST